MKMRIDLTGKEYDYLINNLLKDHREILSKLESSHSGEDTIIINLEEDVSGDIRELAADAIGMNGFDKNYEPTEEGWILEHFIDKFYVG